MPSKKNSLSNLQFWLAFTFAGGAAGLIFSSILKGRLDWPFLAGWFTGSTVGFLIIRIIAKRED